MHYIQPAVATGHASCPAAAGSADRPVPPCPLPDRAGHCPGNRATLGELPAVRGSICPDAARETQPARDPVPANRAGNSSGCDPTPSLKLYGAFNQQILDLAYRPGRIESLRTCVHAVHDRMAAEQAVWILKIVQPLVGRLIAGIGKKTIRLKQACGTDELVGVPPE